MLQAGGATGSLGIQETTALMDFDVRACASAHLYAVYCSAILLLCIGIAPNTGPNGIHLPNRTFIALAHGPLFYFSILDPQVVMRVESKPGSSPQAGVDDTAAQLQDLQFVPVSVKLVKTTEVRAGKPSPGLLP
jgi:hypothetical protein